MCLVVYIIGTSVRYITQYAHDKVSIVIPVYNEEDSLRPLIDEITEVMNKTDFQYEIVLVDDGSLDRSVDIARELYEADKVHVRLIILRKNFGQTAAMAAGFANATGELIISMDADLQNAPHDLPAMVAKIEEGYDVVSGWRADRMDKFITRRISSMIANWLISHITSVLLHDYGCTLKVYHREVAEDIRFYGELHRFLPALASWRGARIAEMKVNHRPRRFGSSKYGIGRTIRVVLDLITIKFLLSYSTKPMRIFGQWGLPSLGLGMLAGLFTILMKLFVGHDVPGNPWMYIAIFCLLGGLQLLCMGLLGEINIRTYYESQNKPIYAIRERLTGED